MSELKGPEFQTVLRLAFFLGGMLLFHLWERTKPFRSPSPKKRQLNHLALTIINSLLLKFFIPFSLVFLALSSEGFRLNLLQMKSFSLWISLPLTIILLDFIIYWQHRLFHVMPLLWRLHRVHHGDQYFDFSTALRFHTLEILLSFLIKASIVIFLGLPAEGIIAFEILLNFSAMFNHSNANIPEKMDILLSKFIVTPSFHRVHHATESQFINSNFGFCLSFWDHLFLTHKTIDNVTQHVMDIGLKKHKGESDLLSLLIEPFKEERQSRN